MKELEFKYRMYGLVPYNLSPIQQGIQFGHAVVEYGQNVKGIDNFEKIYNKWANEDKTFIILNGGTTNTNPDNLGTLNSHMITISDIGINAATFYEPDLGDQLTAVVFLVDERVFDKEKYPNLEFIPDIPRMFMTDEEGELYLKWVESIGGNRNARLRDFLKGFRLA